MSDFIKVQISLDENELKELFMAEVQKRIDEMELQSMLMDAKQLCVMLSLSWPTVEKIFISDPDFPSIRVGKKWIFNRKEVQKYIDSWSKEVREKHDGFVNLGETISEK